MIAFIAPVIILLLSIFQSGLKHLRFQYENQKNQSETKLREQLKSESESNLTNIDKIKNTIEELEKIKKKAIRKLSLLNPKLQIIKIFIPLLLSLFSLIVINIIHKVPSNSIRLLIFTFSSSLFNYVLILLSILLLSYSIYSIWKLLNVIIEIKSNVDEENENRENKKIDLLNSILSVTSRSYLTEVYPCINDKTIMDNTEEFELSLNENRKLIFAIYNKEESMVKNVEVGMIFPYDFIIDESEGYSIYSGEEEQIVRFNAKMIHANTKSLFSHYPLSLTPINPNTYDIKIFIKGENVTLNYITIHFIVE